MTPEMQHVDSTSVESVGFDPEANELWIEFASGDTYVYSLVPRSTYRALLDSGSIGAFINREIKPHHAYRAV